MKNTTFYSKYRSCVPMHSIAQLCHICYIHSREMFSSNLSSCYTAFNAKLFEDAAMLPAGYVGTYLHIIASLLNFQIFIFRHS